MFGIGTGELILILIAILIIFGPKNLPKIGGALGAGIREFKAATRSAEEAASAEPQPAAPAPAAALPAAQPAAAAPTYARGAAESAPAADNAPKA